MEFAQDLYHVKCRLYNEFICSILNYLEVPAVRSIFIVNNALKLLEIVRYSSLGKSYSETNWHCMYFLSDLIQIICTLLYMLNSFALKITDQIIRRKLLSTILVRPFKIVPACTMIPPYLYPCLSQIFSNFLICVCCCVIIKKVMAASIPWYSSHDVLHDYNQLHFATQVNGTQIMGFLVFALFHVIAQSLFIWIAVQLSFVPLNF